MTSAAVLGATVGFLAELAGDGRALEFAVGTGRVGVPLRERGVPVTGIELSEHMAAVLRRKVDEDTLPVVIGDMATTVVPGEFSLVYLVYNTISNLLTQDEQVECFRNAARHLRPGGRFVILEFSTPRSVVVRGAYHAYFHTVLPAVGRAVSGHRTAYRYLPESVARFPVQEELARAMREAGFVDVRWESVTLGVAAIHSGDKPPRANEPA